LIEQQLKNERYYERAAAREIEPELERERAKALGAEIVR